MTPPSSPQPETLPPLTRRVVDHAWALGAVGLVGLIATALATFGLAGPEGPWLAGASAGAASLHIAWLSSGVLAGLYALFVAGLGWPLARWLARGSSLGVWHQWGLGLGATLWLTHLLGVFGLLSGVVGLITAYALLLGGVALVTLQLTGAVRARVRIPSLPPTALLGVGGVAVLVLASASAPSWLWGSEAGGFDSLSYHLQLPIEWARSTSEGGVGRLWPVEHNVYSFLPSYAEAVYLHVHALTGGGASRTGLGGGMLGSGGLGVLACQFIHAACVLLTGALVGRVAMVVLERAGLARGGRTGAGVALAVAVATPWMVVVGSLTYNEAMVTALGAAALLASLDHGLTPWRRGVVVGLLMGAACGCKPTAMFLLGPMVGLSVLVQTWWGPARGALGGGQTSLRAVATAVAGVVVGGTLAFAPPLVRNAIASGNPVFPAATAIFGTAHWTTEQAARFRDAHGGSETPRQRLDRLVDARPEPQAEIEAERQPRGIFHEQWSALFPVGIASMLVLAPVGALSRKPERRRELLALSGVLLVGVAAALVWWVGFSHAQSRFLVPLVVPLAVGVGVVAGACWHGASAGGAWAHASRLGAVVLAMLPAWLSAQSVVLYLRQRNANPNAGMVVGVDRFSGELTRAQMATMTPDERAATLASAPPQVFVNLTVDPRETVYLLGDAAPLYYTGRVLYHTTWDRSPLGEAIEANPNNPSLWRRALRDRGVSWVLVNYAELVRYWESDWYDPRVSSERVEQFIATLGEPVKVWREGSGGVAVALYRLAPAVERAARDDHGGNR